MLSTLTRASLRRRFPAAVHDLLPSQPHPHLCSRSRSINFVADAHTERATAKTVAPPSASYRGHHVILDVTNAVVHGGVAEIDTMGRGLLSAMASAARKEGANVLMKHIEVFDGKGSPPGFASVVLLDESHISAHCYSDTGLLAIDAFTCGENPSSTERVAEHIAAHVKTEFPNASMEFCALPRFGHFDTKDDTDKFSGQYAAVTARKIETAASAAAAAAAGIGSDTASKAFVLDTAKQVQHNAVASYVRNTYRHYNAMSLIEAADGYRELIENDGKMFLTLAGAMSTAEIGVSLAEMIRADKVHAISCTGANLEEDFFNLVAHKSYTRIPDWRGISREEDQKLYNEGLNRVTDTCIPEEEAFRRCEKALLDVWAEACENGETLAPHELFYRLVRRGTLAHEYEIDVADSWLVAAAEKNLPIVCPGWEDSTCGNIIVATKMSDNIPHYPIETGLEQMERLVDWYLETQENHDVGFFQIGGGIAGDFPVCAVPLIRQDLKRPDCSLWSYFCQISDGTTSYGGYSAAPPNEKISWGKLSPTTPSFIVESDATIVWPLVCSIVLSDNK